jgi:hypothetical protein
VLLTFVGADLSRKNIDFIRLTRAKNPEKPYDLFFPKQ